MRDDGEPNPVRKTGKRTEPRSGAERETESGSLKGKPKRTGNGAKSALDATSNRGEPDEEKGGRLVRARLIQDGEDHWDDQGIRPGGTVPDAGRRSDGFFVEFKRLLNRNARGEDLSKVANVVMDKAMAGDAKAIDLVTKFTQRVPRPEPPRVPDGWKELPDPLTLDSAREALGEVARFASQGADDLWVTTTRSALLSFIEQAEAKQIDDVERRIAELEEGADRGL